MIFFKISILFSCHLSYKCVAGCPNIFFPLNSEILVFTAFRRRKNTLSDTVYGDCSLLG